MTRRYLALTVLVFAIFINLVIPACGSKNNNNSNQYPYGVGTSCINGVCSGVGGTPMFPTAIMTTIDNYGSGAQIMIYSTGGTTVNVQAQVYISPQQGLCQPGTFMVQGSGSWQPNYGGTLGFIQASMTGSGGFSVQLSGEVYGGQDPYQSQPTQFFYQGHFANSCDQNAQAL